MMSSRVHPRHVRAGHIAAIALAACGCSVEAASVGDTVDDDQLLASRTDSLAAATTVAGRRDDQNRRQVTTTAIGPTGRIEVSDFFVGAVFFADEIILRANANPECVAHIGAAEKPFAPAGALTVSSDLVGTPGGPPAALVINPDAINEYFEFPDPPLFQFPDGAKTQVKLGGTPVFPAIPLTTLRTPIFALVTVTAPVLPDTGTLTVQSRAPLHFAWDVPSSHGGSRPFAHRQSVSVRLFALGPVRWGQLYCTWPISAGRGQIPAVLMSEMQAQLGGTGAVDGVLDVYAGEFKELTPANASYVVFATTDPVTTFPRSTPILFE
jgi:hypothetical protein